MRRYCATLACVLILAAAASDAVAKADLGLKGIGVKVGIVEPENLDTAIGLGIFADMGTFHPNVAFETYIGYWSKSQSVMFGESSFRDIAIGAKAKYVFPLKNPNIRPFVGGGLGLHFLRGEASMGDIDLGGGVIIPGYSIDSSDTKAGLDLGGGLRAAVSDDIDIAGELWYTFVSDINQLGITVGMLYRLP